MMSMMAGSQAAQSAGQSAQQSALKGGTQKDALLAAANAQDATAAAQGGIGIANVGMGALLLMKGSQHTKFGTEIEGGSRTGIAEANKTGRMDAGKLSGEGDAGWVKANAATISGKIIQNYNLNRESGVFTKVDQSKMGTTEHSLYEAQHTARQTEIEEHEAWVKEKARQIGSSAHSEQKAVGNSAKTASLMPMLMGMTQITQAANARAAANRLRAQAAELDQTKSAPSTLKPPTRGVSSSTGTLGQMPPPITGGGSFADPATADSEEAKVDETNIGPGFNPNPAPSNVSQGPQAGAFKPGSGSGGGGGGGGASGGGGGSTGAAEGGDSEGAGPQLAPQQGQSYESGGTFSAGGGGGKGADGGPDLSGLLGSLLPKKEDPRPESNIMQFGNRPDGGGDENNSVLGKNANLWQRVHDRMTYELNRGNLASK